MPNFSGIWTVTQQMQAKGASTWPTPPGAPTIGTATAGTLACASVTFTAPACTGYPAGVTGYRAISTPGCLTVTGASSPLSFSGLTVGTSYTFRVQATNASGYGALSAASNSVTATVITCATYTTAGTYSWVAPSGVTSVAVVAVGGGGNASSGSCAQYAGGGGGGGALAYANGISVTPGSSYTVRVGPANCNSYFNTEVNAGEGSNASGINGGNGGVVTAGTGYSGGKGGGGGTPSTRSGGGGGGGAGGYAGVGGLGGKGLTAGAAGSGGAGGGGGSQYTCAYSSGNFTWPGGGGGGGVGLFGQGSSGAATSAGSLQGGNGGSGGSNGAAGSYASGSWPGGIGGTYGGGGGGGGFNYCAPYWGGGSSGPGRPGAVRIVWCKCGARGTPSFPSTNVGA